MMIFTKFPVTFISYSSKGVSGGPSGPSREGPGVGYRIVSDTKQMTKEREKKKEMSGKRKKCVKKKQVWSTNRCVLLTVFSTLNMDRWTNQQTYLPIEMQLYISVMFLPDSIQEEKPSFFNFENNWLRKDGPTDGRTNRHDFL